MSKMKFFTYIGKTKVILNNHKSFEDYVMLEDELKQDMISQYDYYMTKKSETINTEQIDATNIDAEYPKFELQPTEVLLSKEDFKKLEIELKKTARSKIDNNGSDIHVYSDFGNFLILIIKQEKENE